MSSKSGNPSFVGATSEHFEYGGFSPSSPPTIGEMVLLSGGKLAISGPAVARSSCD